MRPLLAACLFLATSLASAAPSNADDIPSILDALNKAATEQAQNTQQGTAYYGQQLVSGLQMAYKTGDYNQMLQLLRSAPRVFTKEEDAGLLLKLTSLVQETMEKQAEEFRTKLDRLLEEQGALLLKAKDPKDVDPVLGTLNTALKDYARPYGGSYNGDGQNLINAAIQITANWQDYLQAVQTGDLRTAQSELSSIKDSATRVPTFLSRSIVLEKMEALKKGEAPASGPSTVEQQEAAMQQATALVAGCLKPADIPATWEKLQALPLTASQKNGLPSLYSSFRSLDNAYDSIKQQNYEFAIQLLVRSSGFQQDSDSIQSLRSQLIMQCLPSYLETGKEPSKEGETLNRYLDRLIQQAIDRREWSAAYRGLNLIRFLQNGNPVSDPTLSNDTSAVSYLISGINYATANQWELSARSFIRALGMAKTIDIAPYVKEQLEIIRKEHPEEYAAGQEPELPSSYYRLSAAALQALERERAQQQHLPNKLPTTLPPGPLKVPSAADPSKDNQ